MITSTTLIRTPSSGLQDPSVYFIISNEETRENESNRSPIKVVVTWTEIILANFPGLVFFSFEEKNQFIRWETKLRSFPLERFLKYGIAWSRVPEWWGKSVNHFLLHIILIHLHKRSPVLNETFFSTESFTNAVKWWTRKSYFDFVYWKFVLFHLA